MINWDRGMTSETYITLVDPVTWHDTERIEITGGSISRTNEGLRNAADIEFVNYDQSSERWIRVWMDCRQEGGSDHVALFTGLASSPDRNIKGTLVTNKVTCNSVLQPADDILLPRGWFVPAKANAATVIRDLLTVSPAPVEVGTGAPNLLESIVAEDNETRLSMVTKILEAIGWRMQICGDGTIVIGEEASEISVMFDPIENDCIETELTVEYDWYSAPNVFRAVTDTDAVTIRDEDPDSRLSTVTRGREIWMEETDCKLNDGESLQGYAERRLKEEQTVVYKVKYKRRFHPDILVSDRVGLHYPAQDIQGTFIVESQSIELGLGATTSEEVTAI